MEKQPATALTFEVSIQDLRLTREQEHDLAEKLKCAIVLLLQQRVTCEQVRAAPKAPDL